MEVTIQDKLEALFKLQQIDTKIDQISKLKGDLPQEVRDLEDDCAGLRTRIEKYKEEIKFIEEEIAAKKIHIKSSNDLIKKYKVQQNNVKNNREYEAITKEIELQGLEILSTEKRMKEYSVLIDEKKKEIKDTQVKLDEVSSNLELKKSELEVITKEYEDEEKKLKSSAEKSCKIIEDRLITAYRKIRHNAKNGLAIVNVQRNACGGCFATVPPQRQAEIRSKKNIIVCENCGRIFSEVEVEAE